MRIKINMGGPYGPDPNEIRVQEKECPECGELMKIDFLFRVHRCTTEFCEHIEAIQDNEIEYVNRVAV